MSLGLSVIGQFAIGQEVESVSFAWFEGLSEPVRFRVMATALQPYYTADTAVIPTSKLIEWFMAFSEPIRFWPGLAERLQQFLAEPTRLLPNPTISGTLSALETKDTFLGAGSVFNRVISGEIGVIGPAMPSAQIGVAIPVIYGARVAITIL